jgi:hypothetical protein
MSLRLGVAVGWGQIKETEMSTRLSVKQALTAVVIVAWIVPAAGQAPAPRTEAKRPGGTKAWTLPRTPWGHPDLQGIWNNGTPTPLERSENLSGQEFLSEKEWAATAEEVRTRAERRPANAAADVALAYNNEWYDRGAPLKRTSLIVDPSNGKLPPLTPDGQRRVAANAAARARRGPADSWEDRSLQERCLLYHAVPPFPTGYNNNYLIAQTPEYVAIQYEMLAEIRIIPLDGRPHLGPNLRQWMGNSRGRWEGNTLVVETTDFSDKTTFRFPASDALRVVERFTRTADGTIDYDFTVHDQATYTKPWTAVLPMAKSEGPIYEYACHEGNYGMTNLLLGHRAEEKAAAEAAKKSSR